MKFLGVSNSYSGSNQLHGTANDINCFSKVWAAKFPQTAFTIKQNLTAQQMATTMKSFFAQQDDVLIFHYAGHGTQVKDLNGDEVDGFDEVLVGNDLRFVIDDDICKWVSASPAKLIIFISDSCHSGTICDLKFKLDNSSTAIPKDKLIVSISGCRDDQFSGESCVSGNMVRGVMTYNLENYIKSAITITLGDLMKYFITNEIGQESMIWTNQPINPHYDLFGTSRNLIIPTKKISEGPSPLLVALTLGVILLL